MFFRYDNKTFVFWLSVCCLLPLWGCQAPSAPERALTRFREAVAQGHGAEVWKLLATSSQRTWNALARQSNNKTGKQLFLAGDVWRPTRLRRDPKHRPQISKDRAVLFFRNELEQPIRIELVREAQGWRIVLPASRPPKVRLTTTHSSQ